MAAISCFDSNCLFTSISVNNKQFILKAHIAPPGVSIENWNKCVRYIENRLGDTRFLNDLKLPNKNHIDKISDLIHYSLTFMHKFEMNYFTYHAVGDIINVHLFVSNAPMSTQSLQKIVKPADILARRNTLGIEQQPFYPQSLPFNDRGGVVNRLPAGNFFFHLLKSR